ncbi:MAG: cyclic pyranopterin monophosphate synthase MoaC/MOSC-domain-containing protein [Finegoldia sp.]|nr:cyclic pyranopterin monophosphate synthase MoaC/MOSC-domain-containing protein [Finegoldia sp.]
MEYLSHFNKNGLPRMVDVSDKDTTKRIAKAHSRIYMKEETLKRITDKTIKKGDVLSVAQTAGIMAAKKTGDIIPMCHNIFITGVDIEFEFGENFIDIFVQTNTESKTGVEMESLVASSVTALTIYDMCKAIDRGMLITDTELIYKEGGKSGIYTKEDTPIVIDVNVSEQKGTLKKPIDLAEVIEDYGIKGDAHAGKWHRQVSLLAEESIDKMRAKGIDLKDGDFGENITTRNIELHTLPVGAKLKIGSCILEVTQIGKECHSSCQIKKKVGSCIMPLEGIFTKVLRGGQIKRGDSIFVID